MISLLQNKQDYSTFLNISFYLNDAINMILVS